MSLSPDIISQHTDTEHILDGRVASKAIRSQIKKAVDRIKDQGGRPPHLAAVLVGNNAASRTYVNAKVKACEQVGFLSSLVEMPITITQKQLMQQIEALNDDKNINGFIVQLPLPKHLDADAVTLAVHPDKDVDGFHPTNIGRMVLGQRAFLPATPSGIMQLLRYYRIDTAGKHCVVIGRSNIVGTPMSIMMSRNSYPGNCTVTLAHSRTKNLEEVTRSADILIVAVGKAEFIKGDMVKDGAVVVDVGIHRITDESKPRGYRLVGDVDFESTKKVASAITPVPGGVGPMTITSLLVNTLQAVGVELTDEQT